MKFLMMALTAVIVLATACSSKKSAEGVDSDGFCTQATIDSYNSISSNTKAFLKTNQTSYLKTASAECARFSSLIGGESCNARDAKTNAAIVISLADTNKVCEGVDKILNPPKTNKAEDGGALEDVSVESEVLYELF